MDYKTKINLLQNIGWTALAFQFVSVFLGWILDHSFFLFNLMFFSILIFSGLARSYFWVMQFRNLAKKTLNQNIDLIKTITELKLENDKLKKQLKKPKIKKGKTTSRRILR